MGRLTPQQFAEKQATRLKNAVNDMRTGVQAVTVAPSSLAISKKNKMRENILKAIDNGDWEAGLRTVTLDDWKNAMLNKGIDRVSKGIDEAKGKLVMFAEQLEPFQDALSAEIKKMPDLTIEDAVNRSAAWIRGMSKFKFRKA